MTDNASTNTKCERGIRLDDKPDYQHFEGHCDMHSSAICFNYTFELMSYTTTGMVRTALSVQQAGYMSRFRTVFKSVIRPLVKVKFRRCSEEARLHRLRFIQLFNASGRRMIPKFVANNKFPNGDWRIQSEIEVYVNVDPSDPNFSEQKVIDYCVSGMLFCFCAAKFYAFKKQRWFGAEQTCDQFGAMESCHG